MKKALIILLSILSYTTLFAQSSQEIKILEFIEQKGDGFNIAYDKRDTTTYKLLLGEYLSLYKQLSTDQKKKESTTIANIYYNLTCIYSLLNNKASAITCLKKAIEVGYNDYRHIQEDSDLDNIRNEKHFLALNEQLKNTGDYISILKKAGNYNFSENRPLPDFIYQSSSDSNLIFLRNKYNLDSIAGNGTDVLKIINLLRWVHKIIPHNGTNGNPDIKNAASMIDVCKQADRGLNCRGLAIVLNECYLALGLKSRIVTCLPKDSLKIDPDCHVINAVYSKSLEKWLWMDPTFSAFVMNEKGDLLSIEEVRERLINSKPLLLNPDANWNNQTIQKRENYLDNYMAKNLYMLECPVSSEYNMETATNGKVYTYVKLLPLDYHEQMPDKVEEKGKKSGSSWVTYKTNNPNIFWKKPE
ncbi:MAG: transglutaminase domain-containing protein [Bacteroidetes bacterium]|nr:transglutaminase domain-containing protein [Bacteroidota bacterium]